MDDEELAKSLFTDADGEKVKRVLDSVSLVGIEKNTTTKKMPPLAKPKSVLSLGIKRKNEDAAPATSKIVKITVTNDGKGKKPLIDYPSSDDD